MKISRVVAIVVGSMFVAYCATFGALYVAGYRVYRFPTVAMQPTILQGESTIGRLSESYRDRVRRFDIAIFRTPQAPNEIYAKRVIGMPGERIVIDGTGVRIDGMPLMLPDSVSPAGLGLKKCDTLIPTDSVFMLGDFTVNSWDSRYLGPIPKRDLLGYLVFKK